MLGFVGVVAIPSPRPHSTATVWDRVNSLSIIDFSLLGPRGTRLGVSAALLRPRQASFSLTMESPLS